MNYGLWKKEEKRQEKRPKNVEKTPAAQDDRKSGESETFEEVKMKKWITLFVILALLSIGLFIALTQTKPTITKTQQVLLRVLPKPDFTLDVGVAQVDVYPGQTGVYVATVDSVNGFAGEIVFSISGEPPGSIISILPSSTVTIAPGQPKGCQIEIAVPDDSALVGDYTITVTASSDTYN